MLKSRILTAVVGVPLIVLWLWFSNEYFLALGLSLISITGIFEFYRAAGLWQNKKIICTIGFIAAAVVPFGFMIPSVWCRALSVLFVIVLFFLMLCKHKDIKLTDISVIAFGVLYIPYLLSYMVSVRLLGGGNVYVWLVPLAAFSSDTFAYTAGLLFGKRKLCPEISPKKTIAGAVGGIVGCAAVLVLFAYLGGFGIARFALMGTVCGVVCEFGDMFASVVKRQYGVKDYGNLLPGHGGILDRLDSIIVAAPIVYLFLTAF